MAKKNKTDVAVDNEKCKICGDDRVCNCADMIANQPMEYPVIYKRCVNCAFFDMNTCHFNPPVATLSGTIWPKVKNEDWCGQFKENK